MAAAVAAIRETVEETAVPVGLSPDAGRGDRARAAGRARRRRAFRGLAARSRPELDASALTLFARWVPEVPRGAAVRHPVLSSRAARDGDWQPRVIEGECTGAAWLTAAEVLDRDRRGEARLIFPTRRNLERLAQHASFDEIRADALAHPIEPVTPWVEEREGERFITIPDHLGYPVTEERLDGLWRG